MRLNKRVAQKDERKSVFSNIRWCRKHNQLLGGFPFIDDLITSEGIYLQLLVPSGASPADITHALMEGYSKRDVIRHEVIECPTGWFAKAFP